MPNISPETALALLIWGFFLSDSALLLYRNEFVFARRGEKWASMPGTRFELSRRTLFFMSPLWVGNPVCRTYWSPSKWQNLGEDGSYHGYDDAIAKYRVLAPFVYVVLGYVVVLIPILLLTVQTGPKVWYAIGLGYLSVLVLLAFAGAYGLLRGLTTWKKVALFLELLACPPYAANLIRRLTLLRSPSMDTLDFALSGCSADALLETVKAILEDEDGKKSLDALCKALIAENGDGESNE